MKKIQFMSLMALMLLVSNTTMAQIDSKSEISLVKVLQKPSLLPSPADSMIPTQPREMTPVVWPSTSSISIASHPKLKSEVPLLISTQVPR